MIYICSDINNSEDYSRYFDVLSKERQKKAESYKFIKDRNLSILSFILLRYALYWEYRIYDIPITAINKFGKPYLRNSKLEFNISHCDSAIGCAIDYNSVGIDIQDYDEKLIDIAEDFLSYKELKIAEDINQLCRFWSLKEAYGKFYGIGLNYDFTNMDFSRVKEGTNWQDFNGIKVLSDSNENFAISVFSVAPIKIKKIDIDTLCNFAKRITNSEHSC